MLILDYNPSHFYRLLFIMVIRLSLCISINLNGIALCRFLCRRHHSFAHSIRYDFFLVEPQATSTYAPAGFKCHYYTLDDKSNLHKM